MHSGGSIDWSTVAVGDFVEGGYFAGKYQLGGVIYALIVAPGGGVLQPNLQWKTSVTGTIVANFNDGLFNTQAIIANNPSAHPAAKYCSDFSANGFDDWYLPSKNELEICYRNFKPSTTANVSTNNSGSNPNAVPPTDKYQTYSPAQTTVEIFKQNGAEYFFPGRYWTSSESDSYRAWIQYFNNGLQTGNSGNSDTDKISGAYVRPMRRVLIG